MPTTEEKGIAKLKGLADEDMANVSQYLAVEAKNLSWVDASSRASTKKVMMALVGLLNAALSERHWAGWKVLRDADMAALERVESLMQGEADACRKEGIVPSEEPTFLALRKVLRREIKRRKK